jgi:hypothetical protein
VRLQHAHHGRQLGCTLSQLESGAGHPTIETVFSDPDVVLVRSADLEVLSSNAVDLRMLRRLDITAEVVEV